MLCGEFVPQIHLTDRYTEDEARAADSIGVWGNYYRFRRRDGLYRTKVANQVLRSTGLKVSEWAGRKYILRDG